MQSEQAHVSVAQRGFSLVELAVVIAVLGILAAIAIPVIVGMDQRAKLANDQSMVRTLNNSTALLRVEADPDPFVGAGGTDVSRMNLLVDAGYLDAPVVPLTKDAQFSWVASDERWHLQLPPGFTTIGLADGLETGRGGQSTILKGSYTGGGTNVMIPGSVGGTTLTAIYQDVFAGKGLTSLSFGADSAITQIHARAFQNNQLTEVVLPDTLTRIDTRAFYGNPITRVRIPDSVTAIESNAFSALTEITVGDGIKTLPNDAINGNNKFRDAYRAAGGGAGTYIWNGSAWVKSAG